MKTSPDETRSSPSPPSLPVVEERLSVEKRVVERGGVRLHKRVHEEVVTIDEALETEDVEVERIAVGTVVDGPVEIRYEGDTMIVPVIAERLVTRVERVLVEEVRVTRRKRIVHEPQEVTVRRQEVVAVRLDDAGREIGPIG